MTCIDPSMRLVMLNLVKSELMCHHVVRVCACVCSVHCLLYADLIP